MIDLRRLHVLRAVAHHGTVTAAASALHFTPSAASQQIRQLGRDLGVPLLEPHGRNVRLTQAAWTLLSHADAIETRWEQAKIELDATREAPEGLLRVSGFPTAVTVLLAPMAAALRASHPRLTVRVRETGVPESFDLLFDERIDLAVVEVTPDGPALRDARFDQRPLLDDPFDLVLPRDHRLTGRAEVDLGELADEDWVVPSAASTCHAHTMTACHAAGFTPSVAHEAVDWNAVGALVAHGLGVALVPRLARLAPDLPVTRLCCTGNPSRKLLTCTRRGGREHPAVAAALHELENGIIGR
jgi:DNA-binding transcriptional LysR family regulator